MLRVVGGGSQRGATEVFGGGTPRDLLLERSGELAALEDALADAARGRGSVMTVVGAAGIGKTTLLRAARDRAHAAGFTALTASGGELEREFPHGVTRQLLERRLRDGPRPTPFTGAAAPAAAALGLAAGEAASEDFAIVHGLYWICAQIATEQPLLVMIDDAHWGDVASLRFAAYLARRADELPLVLLVGSRPVPRGENPYLDAILDLQDVRTLKPAALSPSAVAGLLRETLGGDADPSFARACHEATGGNPFLCRAVAASLRERDPLPPPAEIATLAARSASGLAISRLGRLAPAATELARAVAVLGSHAELRHASALAELEEEDGARAADALAVAGILRVQRPLEFVHPLVRAAVAEHMPAAARMRAHRRAARLLDDSGAEPDAVAAQLLATDPAGDPWAIERLVAAADLAAQRGASDAAVTYLRRAVEEGPPPIELVHRLGLAELRAGAYVAAVEDLRTAFAHDEDPDRRARVAWDLVQALAGVGRLHDAAHVIGEALEQADALSADALASLRGSLLQLVALEPELRPMADGLVPDGRTALRGNTRGEREYLAGLTSDAALGRLAATEAVEYGRRAFEAGVGEALLVGLSWNNVVYPVIGAEAYDLGERIIADGFSRLQGVASTGGTTRVYGARAWLNLRRGELREAVADGLLAIRTGREGGVNVWRLALAVTLEAMSAMGDADAAAALLAESGQDAEIEDGFIANWVLWGRGVMHLARSERAAALADFEEGLRRAQARGQYNPSLLPFRHGLALALGPEQADRARALAAEDLGLARRWGTPRPIGFALRAAGLLEPDQEAGLELLRQSVDTLAQSPARLERARSLVALGEALRRSGRRADAREPLHDGMELAHACGAQPLVARALVELRATGARPRKVVRSGVDALTPSEMRVARMAVEGLSNPEIAQALYVTLRTVEGHLTQAYAKLGISSRRELAGAMAGD